MKSSEPMTIRAYRPADEAAVVELWGRCGLLRPQNDPRKDIQRKLKVSPELFLIGALGSDVIATAMAGYEGHRGWISYLGVDPTLQKHGYGRQIMSRAEELLRERGCPKINLQVRSSNREVIAFYHRLGFSFDEVLSMGKRLISDQPAAAPDSPT
jgi:ribosomal protein S18 acetylase RimI-like enzyme